MEQLLADARHENREQAQARARSLAAFYASGGLLNVVSCLIPGWHPASEAGLLAVAGVAFATAAMLFIAGSRVRDRLCHALVAGGSGLIGACMLSAGPSPMALAYGFFFTWVSVYAANWWGGASLAGHLGVAAGCEAAALELAGLSGLVVPACLVSMGACAAAGLVVHRLRAQVRELAMRDPLTRALNRRGLAQMLVAPSREGEARTILALDLDGFKAYNDSLGHARGDQALRSCAAGWMALLGTGEACARLGGDEFLLVCRRAPSEMAVLVRQVRAAAPQPLRVSVGQATEAAGEQAAAVFARADAALYLDKKVPAQRQRDGAVVPGRAVAMRLASQPK